MKQRIVVCCLVHRGNDYLFIKQDKSNGAYPNTYHIPGGGLDLGEDLEKGVRREVFEETNINLKNVKKAHFDYDLLDYYKGSPHQLIYLYYTAEYGSGEPTPKSDAKEIIWVNKKELRLL